MSDYFKHPYFTKRQQNLQWINHLTSTHDMLCRCDQPLQHSIVNILEFEKSLKEDTKFKEIVKKCLFTEDGDTEKQDGDLTGLEDIEALFAGEEKEEDHTG